MADLIVAVEGGSVSLPFGVDPLDIDEGFAPVYAKDHRYHFIIDLESYTGTLTLGYGDGGAFDNSSDTYSIELFQARRVPRPDGNVPEPATLLLLGLGLLGLYVARPGRARISTDCQTV